LPFEERLDFAFIASLIEEGRLPFVAYRQPDRIARHTLPAENLYHHLETHDVDLYLSQLGRRVDWRADRLYLLSSGMISEQERHNTKDRTHGALRRRWLETGRGWPAAKRFGFRRGADQYHEVDPEQWSLLLRMHLDYASVHESGRGSLRRLQEHMDGLGCHFSIERLRTILRDRIYVDGKHSVTYEGVVYPCRTIELPEPVPEDVFEHNQSLLSAIRGPNSVTPFGQFALNHIDVVHARCAAQTVADGRRPRLYGFQGAGTNRASPPGYRHYPRTPDTCRGYVIPAAVLEHAVIGQLRELARSPELLAAWAAAARPQRLIRGELAPEQREGLLGRIRNLQRHRAQIKREWLDEVSGGAPTSMAYLDEKLATLDAEIAGYERQIEESDRMGRRRRMEDGRPAAEPDPELVSRLMTVLTLDPPDDAQLRQRRVAVVAALISEVWVYDTDNGIEIELFGPLVPPDSPLIPTTLEELAEQAQRSREPSTKATLTGRFGSDERIPAWRSPRIALRTHPIECATAENVVRALRHVHETAPPGRLFGSDSTYARIVAQRPELPTYPQLLRYCRRLGKRPEQLVREVLGDDSTRMNRQRHWTLEDLILCARWMLDDGFDPGPGWTKRWEAFAAQRPYGRNLDAVWQWAKIYRTPMTEVFEIAKALGPDLRYTPTVTDR
jgi:hypothetical protein